MCCGRKRQAFRTTAMRGPPPPVVAKADAVAAPARPLVDRLEAVPGPRGPSTAILLRYRGTAAIRMQGPVTGRRYDFAMGGAEQPVDPRDAAVMLRHGAFYSA